MPDRTATGGAIIKLRHYRRPAGRARPAGRESSAAARLRRLARSLLAMRGRPSRVRRDGGRSWRCLPVAHGFEVEHLHPLLALDPPVITATYETARGIEEEDKAELQPDYVRHTVLVSARQEFGEGARLTTGLQATISGRAGSPETSCCGRHRRHRRCVPRRARARAVAGRAVAERIAARHNRIRDTDQAPLKGDRRGLWSGC